MHARPLDRPMDRRAKRNLSGRDETSERAVTPCTGDIDRRDDDSVFRDGTKRVKFTASRCSARKLYTLTYVRPTKLKSHFDFEGTDK